MTNLLKKLLNKLEAPANDWVLSRFGGYEGPESAGGDEQPPVSGVAPIGAQRTFKSWFDEQESLEEASADSGEVSSNASN